VFVGDDGIGTMKPDRFTDERAHHPRKATVQGRLYNIQKTI